MIEEYLALAEGLVPRHDVEHKFGFNAAVGSSREIIWELGGTYTLLATATALFASSSSAADTVTRVVTVEGLDANGLQQTKSVVLTGQTQVAIPGTWRYAVARCWNSGAVATTGNVYIAESTAHPGGVPGDASKIKSFFSSFNQQSLQCVYTVPANARGYIVFVYASVGKLDDAEVKLRIQENGGVERTKWIGRLSSNVIPRDYKIPLRVEPLATITMHGESATATVEVSAGFDLVLQTDPAPRI